MEVATVKPSQVACDFFGGTASACGRGGAKTGGGRALRAREATSLSGLAASAAWHER